MIYIISEFLFIVKLCSEINLIDRRRNGGVKLRNIEFKCERMLFFENNGRIIEEFVMIEDGYKLSYINKYIM